MLDVYFKQMPRYYLFLQDRGRCRDSLGTSALELASRSQSKEHGPNEGAQSHYIDFFFLFLN